MGGMLTGRSLNVSASDFPMLTFLDIYTVYVCVYVEHKVGCDV